MILLFIPMFIKHVWTAYYAPRGRYLSGIYARVMAIYEFLFYLWALSIAGPLAPLVAVMAMAHFIGVPLYFGGYLPRFSKYRRFYSLFETAELVVLITLVVFTQKI